MAKKNKKKRGSAPAKKKSSFGGGLAEQLKQLDVETKESKIVNQAYDAVPKVSKSSKKPKAVNPYVEEPKSDLTDEELFQQALNGIESGNLHQGKYGNAKDDWQPFQDLNRPVIDTDEPVISDAQARENLADLRDMADFERAMGGMDDKFKDNKYHVPEPAHELFLEESPFKTPLLPKDPESLDSMTLQPVQRELLKRYKKFASAQRVPELNVRGDSLKEALSRLDDFVASCSQRKNTFIRVIHGKGKQSSVEPVLKLGVLEWIEDSGRTHVKAFSPELGQDGRFGSLIIELNPR